MKYSGLCSLVILIIMTGCGSIRRHPVLSHTISETKIIRDTVIFTDTTIVFRIPPGSQSSEANLCDTSYLNTGVAESYAWFDGRIHHTLANLSVSVKAETRLPTYIHTEEITVSSSDTVYVEKAMSLSRWQSFRLTIGDIALSVMAAFIVLIFVKKFLL